jgi:hypothetical protein
MAGSLTYRGQLKYFSRPSEDEIIGRVSETPPGALAKHFQQSLVSSLLNGFPGIRGLQPWAGLRSGHLRIRKILGECFPPGICLFLCYPSDEDFELRVSSGIEELATQSPQKSNSDHLPPIDASNVPIVLVELIEEVESPGD